MASYFIRIQLQPGEADNTLILQQAMQKENFTATVSGDQHEKTFQYYGNRQLFDVSEAVQRAVTTTGIPYSFSVAKDVVAEHQFHERSNARLNCLAHSL